MKDYRDEYYNRPKGCERRFLGLLLTFIIFCLILLSHSCEKPQEEYCWRCYMYFYDRIYIDGNVFEKRYQDSIDICGYTERDITKYEVYRTVKPYSISTCGDHIRWQDCFCIKEE